MKKEKTIKEQLNELRGEFPNNQDFGREVAILLETINNFVICCLCEENIEVNPLTKWKYGNNPEPLGEDKHDRCCDKCNVNYVIPSRIAQFKGESITNALNIKP